VFPDMVRNGELYAMATEGFWIDAGRPSTYIDANVHYGRIEGRLVASTLVDPSAHIVDSVIAHGCVVAAGAHVEHSVILPGGFVGGGARVVDSVVQGRIEDGATVRRVVVAHDGVVGRGEVLADCGIPSVEGP